jgi:hypothetical protein
MPQYKLKYMLNLPDVITKIFVLATHVFINLQKMFIALYVDMFVNNFHAQFHLPSTVDSLVIAVRLETEENFCMAAILFDVVEKCILTGLAYF